MITSKPSNGHYEKASSKRVMVTDLRKRWTLDTVCRLDLQHLLLALHVTLFASMWTKRIALMNFSHWPRTYLFSHFETVSSFLRERPPNPVVQVATYCYTAVGFALFGLIDTMWCERGDFGSKTTS